MIATIDTLTFDNPRYNHFSQLRADAVNRGANVLLHLDRCGARVSG